MLKNCMCNVTLVYCYQYEHFIEAMCNRILIENISASSEKKSLNVSKLVIIPLGMSRHHLGICWDFLTYETVFVLFLAVLEILPYPMG